MIVIDLYLLITFLIPPVHRVQEVIDYMTAAFKPLNTLQTSVYEFYEAKKYELTWNGQVIMMEHVLNEQFDPEFDPESIDDWLIYITDAEQTPNVYWFNASENNEETYLYNTSETADPYYLFNSVEYDSDVDFIVNVPAALTYDENLMNYYINKYRSAGKRFLIQEY